MPKPSIKTKVPVGSRLTLGVGLPESSTPFTVAFTSRLGEIATVRDPGEISAEAWAGLDAFLAEAHKLAEVES